MSSPYANEMEKKELGESRIQIGNITFGTERKICYLSKKGVKPGAIEILLGKGNVSVYRKRLYEKLNKKAGTAKDFDKYISDI